MVFSQGGEPYGSDQIWHGRLARIGRVFGKNHQPFLCRCHVDAAMPGGQRGIHGHRAGLAGLVVDGGDDFARRVDKLHRCKVRDGGKSLEVFGKGHAGIVGDSNGIFGAARHTTRLASVQIRVLGGFTLV